MTHVAYVVAGWGATTVAIALYAARVIRRGRQLSPLVPPENRRWS